jgi:hypothetical protein
VFSKTPSRPIAAAATLVNTFAILKTTALVALGNEQALGSEGDDSLLRKCPVAARRGAMRAVHARKHSGVILLCELGSRLGRPDAPQGKVAYNLSWPR